MFKKYSEILAEYDWLYPYPWILIIILGIMPLCVTIALIIDIFISFKIDFVDLRILITLMGLVLLQVFIVTKTYKKN